MLNTGQYATALYGMTVQEQQNATLLEGWCQLSQLHERIQAQVERSLVVDHGISMREFLLLSVLSRQHNGPGGHLHMKQVSEAVVLSQSATTRLVTRLEERGLLARCLCPTDRRGIYTNVTPEGFALLAEAQPTHDRALAEALAASRADQQLAPLFETLETLGSALR
jgi:DNA-binding MarR family transcriptional regulator